MTTVCRLSKKVSKCHFVPSAQAAVSTDCNIFLPVSTVNFPGEPGLAGFIEAKDGGSDGDNWSYKSCKALVKSSPPTSLPVAQPTVSKH